MKFAINYSKPAADLLEAGTIEVDLFKCPEWPELLEEVGRSMPFIFISASSRAGPTFGRPTWMLSPT